MGFENALLSVSRALNTKDRSYISSFRNDISFINGNKMIKASKVQEIIVLSSIIPLLRELHPYLEVYLQKAVKHLFIQEMIHFKRGD